MPATRRSRGAERGRAGATVARLWVVGGSEALQGRAEGRGRKVLG